jgi:glycosyltransferase involved in cell wall biosynthesis
VTLSVVICTWNRADLLAQTLRQMAAARVPAGLRWELVVIDNASPDHTPRVLADAPLPLRAVREPRQGLSHARNRGLDETTGDWLAFTDDDVLVDENWLAELAAGVGRHPEAAVVGGPVEPWFPHPPDPELAEAFPALGYGFVSVDHGPAERELTPTEGIRGANFAVRRAAVGGNRFDPKFGRAGAVQGLFEETDFVNRLRDAGGTVWWLPAVRLRHYVDPRRMTLEHCCAHYEGAGRSDGVRHGGGWAKWAGEAAKAWVRYWAHSARGRRPAALAELRYHMYARGRCRAAGHAPTP